MKLPTALSTLASLHLTGSVLATSAPSPPTHLFANPPPNSPPSANRIPTSQESAVQARRILALSPLATLSTVFPASSSSDDDDGAADTLERRPPGLGGVPIGLEDYIADCEDKGNPTILAIGISTSFKNVAAGSNLSISVNWAPPYPPKKRIESSSPSSLLGRLRDWWRGAGGNGDDDEDGDAHHRPDPVPYSAANLPRFSLLGYLEPITVNDDVAADDEATALQECFLKSHPDAKYWLPGNRIHRSEWVRLVVTEVYWIGGFGDRAYIGWIPLEEWQNVTREEWEDVRLPGEKPGWDEWSVPAGETEL